MQKINVELATYNKIIDALDNQLNGNNIMEIIYPYYVKYDEQIKTSTIPMGKTPRLLTEMGFPKYMVYDREHLEEAMLPDNNRKTEHGHGSTSDELKLIPQLLKSPIAITKNIDTKKGEDVLLFYSAAQHENEEKYYITVVNPYCFHRGVTQQYETMAIVTNYDISEQQFHSMIERLSKDNDKMFYFDNQQYNRLESENKKYALQTLPSFTKSIAQHFHFNEGDERKFYKHLKNVKTAVMQQLQREAERVSYDFSPWKYPILKESLEYLESSDAKDFNEILDARKLIQRACKLGNNANHIQAVTERADIAFAKSYAQCMNKESRIKTLSLLCARLKKFEVYTHDDLSDMYEYVDKLMGKTKTLSSLGVSFCSAVAENKSVKQAHKISAWLEKTAASAFQNIVTQKEMELQQSITHVQPNSFNQHAERDDPMNQIDFDDRER